MDHSARQTLAKSCSRFPPEEIVLLGQPPLSDYLQFVSEDVVDGDGVSQLDLVEEWRSANDYYYELENREAGICDQIDVFELSSKIKPLAERVMSNSIFMHMFDSVPTSFAMVELDKLIIFQTRVAADFVETLKGRMPANPDAQTIFDFCMPLGLPDAPVRALKLGSRRYGFWSESADFRFHEAVMLRPDQIRDYDSFGPISNVLGLVLGFSSNFLSAVRSDNRLVLHNGYHRACALRELGITHAPCIIETVTRSDELKLVAKNQVVDNPAFYFKAKRPPLLKDFFDPKIRKKVPRHNLTRMFEISFKVRETYLPL